MRDLQVLPVVKASIESRATAILRDSIVDGVLPVGSRITEIQLAQQMKISRATLRVALHQLASEGLVKLVPYTGWTVMALTRQDVWELYTLRSVVERLAAQIAARKIDAAGAAILQQALDRLVQTCAADDWNKIAEADFNLHKTIIRLTNHSRLAAQYALIEQQVRIYIRSSDALVSEPSAIVDQHRPIVQAILDGDAERAGLLSEEHNTSEGEKLVSSMPETEAGQDEAALSRSGT